jgi:hypothetical protein
MASNRTPRSLEPAMGQCRRRFGPAQDSLGPTALIGGRSGKAYLPGVR